MITIDIHNTNISLQTIMQQVKPGEEVCLTMHNRKIAFLVAAEEYLSNAAQALPQKSTKTTEETKVDDDEALKTWVELWKKGLIGTPEEAIKMKNYRRKFDRPVDPETKKCNYEALKALAEFNKKHPLGTVEEIIEMKNYGRR